MTDADRKALCQSIDALVDQHPTLMTVGDYYLEKLMIALADLVDMERAAYLSAHPHDTVVALLESCAAELRRASMDYYASMK